jgi:hypothetical protein
LKDEDQKPEIELVEETSWLSVTVIITTSKTTIRVIKMKPIYKFYLNSNQ